MTLTIELPESVIEVEVYTAHADGTWELSSSAYAEDEGGAILAARTLWDEAYSGLQGCKRRIVFRVGESIWQREERP